MVNRTRKIVLRVPVTPEERKPIEQKMALLHTKNFSAYARKMLIDGYIVNMGCRSLASDFRDTPITTTNEDNSSPVICGE